MSKQAQPSAPLFFLAILPFWLSGVARADVLTAPTASIPLTETNWGPGTSGLAAPDPLSIAQFDTQNGARVLDAVNLSFHTLLSVDYSMGLTTPGTVTGSVATGSAGAPGPLMTLYRPDGVTPLLTVQSPSEPSFLTQSYSFGLDPGGTASSGGGSHSNSPSAHLGPQTVDRTYNLTLTSPSDLALFSGTRTVPLPVSAAAVSALTFSSGNGFGQVATKVGVNLTASYQYHSAVLQVAAPEAGGMALWALGGLGLWVARRHRRRWAQSASATRAE